MKKVFDIVREIVLCWLPFAAATYLCYTTLNRIEPADFRFWQPAFYSFLPMSLFLVGAIVYISRKEIRDLRATVEELRRQASRTIATQCALVQSLARESACPSRRTATSS